MAISNKCQLLIIPLPSLHLALRLRSSCDDAIALSRQLRTTARTNMVMSSTGRRRRCVASYWAPFGRTAATLLWRDETIVADILSAPDIDVMMWDAAVRRTKSVEVAVPSGWMSSMGGWGEVGVHRQSFRMVFVRMASITLRKGLPQRQALVDDDAPFQPVGWLN